MNLKYDYITLSQRLNELWLGVKEILGFHGISQIQHRKSLQRFGLCLF